MVFSCVYGFEQVLVPFLATAVSQLLLCKGLLLYGVCEVWMVACRAEGGSLTPLVTIPFSPQYAFFSFPHIAIDSANNVGKISRPNRPGASAACGALCAVRARALDQRLES